MKLLLSYNFGGHSFGSCSDIRDALKGYVDGWITITIAMWRELAYWIDFLHSDFFLD